MANIITELALEMSENWYVSKKLNSVGRVGENTVTKLIIEPTEILDNVTYEIEIADASGSKNVAELTIDGTELYLILTANMLTTSGIMKMQVRGLFTDGSIKKSNIFELKVNRSISATDYYEEYAVTIFDQLVAECRDIIEGAESYAVRAETAAVNAEAYEQSASASADAASASATTASTASTAAVNAATSAETSATSASTSAETASTAAASASASASTATTASETAQAASTTAQTASETAVNASIVATTAQTSAETAANSASTSANNASVSATAASTSAANAAISETNASTSATNASTSETNAATSASNAANSATSASTSATNAANSATAAATSATNAHTSEVNASTSETNASASATEAAETAESIAASVAQINENTYRINDLEAIIAGYQLTDLPTGEIATITDGTALLMPDLKVGIEPVQDLHGYDHPWAGGAGKNLLPFPYTTSSGSITNITVSYGTAGEIKASGTSSAAGNIYLIQSGYKLKAGTYTISANGTHSGVVIFVYNRDISASPAIIYSDTSSTSATFTLTDDLTDGAVYIHWSGAATVDINCTIQLEEGSTATSYSPYSNICPISGWTAANVNVSPTTSAEDGATYNIQFKDGDNPLTVYGGTLDVTTGELVVDRASVDLGSLNWTYVLAQTRFYTQFNCKGPKNNNTVGNIICSTYVSDTYNNVVGEVNDTTIAIPQNGDILTVRDSRYTDATDFKTAMNGVQLVYELATPTTYHLTPTQVRTLVGNNNIWADTGDIIEGKYYRSPF